MQDDHKAIDARFDRTRARNRAAQLRFRQRLQDDQESLQRKVSDADAAVEAARERYAALQRQKVSLSTRTANAVASCAAMRAQNPPRAAPSGQQPTGKAAFPPVSATLAAAKASLHRPNAASPGQSCSTGHDKETCEKSRPAAPHRLSGSLIHSARGPRTLRQPLFPPPRRIAAFRASAGISYDDLRAAADPASRLIDFTEHSIEELSDRVYVTKAAQLQMPREDVCWFTQTLYEVADGLPLSASTTLSSPECLASFGLHFLISRLEMMLVSAAASGTDSEQHEGGGAEQERHSILSPDAAGLTGDTPRSKAPRATPATAAEACAGGTKNGASPNAPMYTRDPAQQARAHDPSPAATAHSAPDQGDVRWSGCIRVGVGGVHDARAAVQTMLHGLVRRFCRLVPLATVYHLMSCYHAVLARMQSGFSAARWKEGGSAVLPSPDARGGEHVRVYMARAMAAARGVVSVFVDVLDAATDMNFLRSLEAEGPAACPFGDECSPERNLDAYAHVAVTICTALQLLALRAVPRLVMNVSFYGTHALARLDDEIDSFHVNLYRQLKLTDADRDRLAAHLKMWRQLSTTLNTPFHSALSTLSSLPQAGDIPAGLVAHINAAAEGAVRRRNVVRREAKPGEAGVRGNKGVRRWPGDSVRLLGSSVKATVAADKGLLGLRDVHETHGRVRRETKELQMQPGVLLRPLQLAQTWSAHIFYRAAQADTIKLCQLATTQQRWRDLASLSQVPPQMPQFQGFEGPAVEASGAAQDGGARVEVLG